MLNENQINLVIDRLVRRIAQGNSFILKKIGKQYKKIQEVEDEKLYELQQELKYGKDLNEIQNKIKEITKLNIKDINEIFMSIARKNQQFAKKYYDYKGIQMTPLDENVNLKEIVKSHSEKVIKEYKKATDGVGYNLLNTTDVLMFLPLILAYQNSIDYAVLKRSYGYSVYNQEIEKQLKKLGQSGLKMYDSIDGKAFRLDNFVKLQMQQGIRDMTNELQEEFGKEYESDGIEISVHSYPAPDHAFVQGHQFTNEEFEKFQNDMDATDINGVTFSADFEGYDRRSIGEYNCYHYVFHVLLGVDKPQYTHEDLSEIVKQNDEGFFYNGKHYTMYEGTQLQNNIKNEIQKQENIRMIAKESGNKDLEMLTRNKIVNLKSKYKDVSDISGLPTEMDKLKEWGYKRLSKEDIDLQPLGNGTYFVSKKEAKTLEQSKIDYKILNDNDIQRLDNNTKQLLNDLNEDEKNSISNYVGISHKEINETLGLGKPKEQIVYKDINEINKDIKNIDSVMNKSQIKEDLTTFRGTYHDFSQYKVGDIFTMKNFASTSTNKNFAIKRAKNKGDGGVLLEIRTPKNTKGLYIGDNFGDQNEKEILLDRNLEYKIIDTTVEIDENYGKYKKYLLEILKNKK